MVFIGTENTMRIHGKGLPAVAKLFLELGADDKGVCLYNSLNYTFVLCIFMYVFHTEKMKKVK